MTPQKALSRLNHTSTIDLVAELAALHAATDRRQRQHRTASAACRHRHLRRGDVAISRVVFTDRSGGKTRHVLVLGFQGPDVVVAPITTHAPRDEFDLEVSYWRKGHLSGPWTLRCSRMTSIARSLVHRIAGRLTTEDWCRTMVTSKRWFETVIAEERRAKRAAA